MPMQTDGAFAHYTKSKKKVRGKDRKGFRGGSILKAFATEGAVLDGHMSARDTRLIEGLRILGADDLTARDEALYQLLLHVARETGVDRECHQIDVSKVWDFLESREKTRIDRRLERLHDSIVRLTRTVVRYTHRDQYGRTYGAMSLLTAEIHEDLSSGTAILDYTLPPAVRHAVQSEKSYTWLELEAFAGFNSRYAPRLYQRLAIGAGMDGPAGKRWEVAPLELARMLNYPVHGDLHFASFERRALQPAMADIKREVSRFQASYRKVPGKGRGRPVASLVFEVTPAKVRFVELQAADLGVGFADHTFHESLRARSYPETYLPSRLYLGKAVTLTKASPEDILERWLDALDRAEAAPSEECVPGVLGASLLWPISVGEKDSAFADFVVRAYESGLEWHAARRSVPAPARLPMPFRAPPTPAPAAAVEQEEPEPEPEETEALPEHDVFDDLDDGPEPPESYWADPQPTGETSDELPFF